MRGRGNAWRPAAGLAAAVLALEAAAQDVCTSCHGPGGNSPTAGVPSIAGQPKRFIENQLVLIREGMRPSPPRKQPVVQELKDAEITRLAGHFATLPARSMEDGPLDQPTARRARERARALRCGICHLPDFKGQGHVPRLAGQREVYLATEMRAYRDGLRKGGDTMMADVLAGVSEADIDALAHFLSRAP